MEKDAQDGKEMTFKERCVDYRKMIEKIKNGVFALRRHWIFEGEQDSSDRHNEMKANIMLAYRHLEDARMRVGKIIQAQDGGVSVYDK